MSEERGLPFSSLTEEERRAVEIIVSDVDDTITKRGKLYPEVLKSLWLLKRKGHMIVLVTGGSSGWADAYIRQWPVDAVIAESGALILAHGQGNKIIYVKNPAIAPDIREKKEKLIKCTAGLTFSSDQYARQYDIAYEKAELRDAERRTLFNYVKAMGGTWRESSIHINVSFGSFDKHTALAYFMSELYSIGEDRLKEKGMYLGDSLNDCGMFSFMPLSVGMHSVEDDRESFPVLPRYITDGYGGDGFIEVSKALLAD